MDFWTAVNCVFGDKGPFQHDIGSVPVILKIEHVPVDGGRFRPICAPHYSMFTKRRANGNSGSGLD
jgi:hypothetical protein